VEGIHTKARRFPVKRLPIGRSALAAAGLSLIALATTAGLQAQVLGAERAEHACTIRTGGVLCWGGNKGGQLGIGAASSGSPFAEWVVPPGSGASAVAAGDLASCAVLAGGVRCWGTDALDALGNGPGRQDLAEPGAWLAGLGQASGVTAIAGFGYSFCAVQGGGLRCWGDNERWQLGYGEEIEQQDAPGAFLPGLGSGSGVAAVAIGPYASCAVQQGGVKCWGSHESRILGEPAGGAGGLSQPGGFVPGLAAGAGATAVALGNRHACAIVSGGVKCWGLNSRGALGLGTVGGSEAVPSAWVEGMEAGSGVTRIAASGLATCAVQGEQIRCWGDTTLGQAGDRVPESPYARPVPEALALFLSPGWKPEALAAGNHAFCARLNHADIPGAVTRDVCWGDQHYGKTGNGRMRQQWNPTRVDPDWSSAGAPLAFAAGRLATCAVAPAGMGKGELYCWGGNGGGVLGIGSPLQVDTAWPVPVAGLGAQDGPWDVAMSLGHACAAAGGGAWCWGTGAQGQLGDGAGGSGLALQPQAVTGLSGEVTQVAVGLSHSCAVETLIVNSLPVSRLLCWGSDQHGQLGNDAAASANSPTPQLVEGLHQGVLGVDAGDSHSCARTSGFALRCWGRNHRGQLGDGSTSSRFVPVAVTIPGGGVGTFATGGAHSCAANSSFVYCWGANDFGQAGQVPDSSPSMVLEPQVVMVSSGIKQLALGGTHSCAVRHVGTLWCWGDNAHGQLGVGLDTAFSAAPVRAQGGWGEAKVLAVAAGEAHTCAEVEDAGIWCWGDAVYGKLGNGELGYQTDPQEVLGAEILRHGFEG
jgi:alpha-tubulin suppressor-like RCC1 family protein